MDLAAKHRLPAIYYERGWVQAGGLMSYGQACLTCPGAPPPMWIRSSKAPSRPTCRWSSRMKFELVINLKTAQALGLTIPPTLLFQADEVIR